VKALTPLIVAALAAAGALALLTWPVTAFLIGLAAALWVFARVAGASQREKKRRKNKKAKKKARKAAATEEEPQND